MVARSKAGSCRGLLDFIVYRKEGTPKRNSDGQSAGVLPETARGSCRTLRGPYFWSVSVKLAQNMLVCRQWCADVATVEQCDDTSDTFVMCTEHYGQATILSSYNYFCGFYAVILKFLWFLCSHPANSMVPMQSPCFFNGFYAVIL